MDKLAEANKKLADENAEISATVDSILTDFLPALFGDGENPDENTEEDTKETDSENTETE